LTHLSSPRSADVLKKVIIDRLRNADQRAGALVDGCLDAVGLYA
jgi:hypothetical protein